MLPKHPSHIRLGAVLITLTLGLGPVMAQTEIPLDELPAPPPQLKRLIEAGRVRFEFGTDRNETERGDTNRRDTDRSDVSAYRTQPNGSSDGFISRGFAAKTSFQIAFDYDARTSWRVASATRELLITVRLRRFKWQPSHTVWFRDRPASETFWTNPLVLHEFDHVRISSDPRMKSKYEELMRKSMVIRHQLSSSESPSARLTKQLTDTLAQSVFEETMDLIRIRYQELDRETAHGTRPLPQGSALFELLRENRSLTNEP